MSAGFRSLAGLPIPGADSLSAVVAWSFRNVASEDVPHQRRRSLP